MPFGRKPDNKGRMTDFDAVYQQIIAPAVISAGLDPIRADGGLNGVQPGYAPRSVGLLLRKPSLPAAR